MRFQFNITPRSHDVAGLTVFISYKTNKLENATRLREVLERIGFKVILFKPVAPIKESEESEVRELLRRELLEADFMCLINSEEVLQSRWIAYEFVQAAMILGRVIIVDTLGRDGQQIADELLDRGAGFSTKSGLQVRHTTLHFTDAWSQQDVETLAAEILNDPEERWYDGTVSVPAGPLDLKQRSALRKAARRHVYQDGRFSDLAIVDVIPYSLDDDRDPRMQPREETLLELLYSEGRLPLVERYRAGDLRVLHARYSLNDVPSATPVQVGAFVVIERSVRKRQPTEISHGQFTDPRDGQRYQTVTINGRTWLAENLRFETEQSWSYDDDRSNARRYGCLYRWDDALRAVPDGWHLASIREWLELATIFGGYRSNIAPDDLGTQEAEQSYAELIEGGGSGFNVRLAGFRTYSGHFSYLDIDGYFWSATEHDSHAAYITIFLGGAEQTQVGWAYKIAGHSVRCVLGETVDWQRGL